MRLHRQQLATFSVLAFFAIALCCSRSVRPTPADESAIWRLVIEKQAWDWRKSAVVEKTLDRSEGADHIRCEALKHMSAATSILEAKILTALCEDLLHRALSPTTVREKVTSENIMGTVDGDFSLLLRGDKTAWDAVNRTMPDVKRVLALSRVGFAMPYALVYVEQTAEGDGSGILFLLEKKGSSWVLVSSNTLWIT
jgi:hypothetical protein